MLRDSRLMCVSFSGTFYRPAGTMQTHRRQCMLDPALQVEQHVDIDAQALTYRLLKH